MKLNFFYLFNMTKFIDIFDETRKKIIKHENLKQGRFYAMAYKRAIHNGGLGIELPIHTRRCWLHSARHDQREGANA
jgi:hypothetical protein